MAESGPSTVPQVGTASPLSWCILAASGCAAGPLPGQPKSQENPHLAARVEKTNLCVVKRQAAGGPRQPSPGLRPVQSTPRRTPLRGPGEGLAPWDTCGVPTHPAAKDMFLRLLVAIFHVSSLCGWQLKSLSAINTEPRLRWLSVLKDIPQAAPTVRGDGGPGAPADPSWACAPGAARGPRAACLPPAEEGPPGVGVSVSGGWVQRTGVWDVGSTPGVHRAGVASRQPRSRPCSGSGSGAFRKGWGQQSRPPARSPHTWRGQRGFGLGACQLWALQRHTSVCSRPDPGPDGGPGVAVTL